jgi:hypothetical protein
MGALNDITAQIVQDLETAGLTVITDPRELRPNVALVEPPRVTGVSANLSRCEWDVNVCATPPGDATAVAALLDLVDTIIETVPVTTASPGVFSTGNQELPSYTCTIQYTINRSA